MKIATLVVGKESAVAVVGKRGIKQNHGVATRIFCKYKTSKTHPLQSLRPSASTFQSIL